MRGSLEECAALQVGVKIYLTAQHAAVVGFDWLPTLCEELPRRKLLCHHVDEAQAHFRLKAVSQATSQCSSSCMEHAAVEMQVTVNPASSALP